MSNKFEQLSMTELNDINGGAVPFIPIAIKAAVKGAAVVVKKVATSKAATGLAAGTGIGAGWAIGEYLAD